MANVDFAFDFETLGKGEETVVLSVAFVPFSWDSLINEGGYAFEDLREEGFEIKFDVEDQVMNWNRKVSKRTVEWWEKQSKEAQKVLAPSDEDVDLKTGVETTVDVLENMGLAKGSQLFCRGQDFDPPILNAICKQVGVELPMNFWDYRDIRSIVQAWTLQRRAKYYPAYQLIGDKMVAHSAIDDCAASIIEMQMAYEHMIKVFTEDAND